MYKKICKFCGKEFEHSSKGTRYCSIECQTKVNKRRLSRIKRLKIRRQSYTDQKEIMRLEARVYKLMDTISSIFLLPKECSMKDDTCSETLHWHHRDMNLLNNSPTNLMCLCTKHHSEVHSKLKSFNTVKVLKECSLNERPDLFYMEALKSLWEDNDLDTKDNSPEPTPILLGGAKFSDFIYDIIQGKPCIFICEGDNKKLYYSFTDSIFLLVEEGTILAAVQSYQIKNFLEYRHLFI